jgi:hypothetical protein
LQNSSVAFGFAIVTGAKPQKAGADQNRAHETSC